MECNVGHVDELLFSLLSGFHDSLPSEAAADANACTHATESNHKEHPEGRHMSVRLPFTSIHNIIAIWASHASVHGESNRATVQLGIRDPWKRRVVVVLEAFATKNVEGCLSLGSITAHITTRKDHSQTIGIHSYKGNLRCISEAGRWFIHKSGDTHTRARVAFVAAGI